LMQNIVSVYHIYFIKNKYLQALIFLIFILNCLLNKNNRFVRQEKLNET
jgi:hypothetical protein